MASSMSEQDELNHALCLATCAAKMEARSYLPRTTHCVPQLTSQSRIIKPLLDNLVPSSWILPNIYILPNIQPFLPHAWSLTVSECYLQLCERITSYLFVERGIGLMVRELTFGSRVLCHCFVSF